MVRMIKLFGWPTPNVQKITILLEELNLPYEICPVNLDRGDQLRPEFLDISPNNKVPAIVHNGRAIFESGTILFYLAEEFGEFLPTKSGERCSVLQWLFFQVACIGPYFGQSYHFRRNAPEPVPYAIARYQREANRLCGVFSAQLNKGTYIAGETYSIADIAAYPWMTLLDRVGVDVSAYPSLARWLSTIEARDGVRRGMRAMSDHVRHGPMTPESWDIMYGDAQFRRFQASGVGS
jgi:GST-like protein